MDVFETNDTPGAEGTTRRDFLGRGALAGLSLAALNGIANKAAAEHHEGHEGKGGKAGSVELYPGAVDASGQYVLPPLPYAYEALEPHIDTETMKLHHDKHHASYVKGLIDAEAGLAKARSEGNYDAINALSNRAAFHGGGHFLHCIFWANMAPEGKGGAPSEKLAAEIAKSFGSQAGFEGQFDAAAKGVEGSGWAILAWSIPAKKLIVMQSEKHNNLTQWGNIPLLVCDVWEHAYYKKYSNVRADYVKAFMKVINWNDVSQRFEALTAMG